MADIDYPATLPDFRLGKQRRQSQGFVTANPLQGAPYIELRSDDLPVTWDVTITCGSQLQAQTFLAFWTDTKEKSESIQSYYCTKFFRHLVSLRKITQDALRPMYAWVPVQEWDRQWTDEMLYAKYGLSDDEIEYIESVIRPMDINGGQVDA